MKKKVLELFLAVLKEDYPDLLQTFETSEGIEPFLESQWLTVEDLFLEMTFNGQPEYIVLCCCLDSLTSALPPSRYQFVRGIVMREFYAAAFALDAKGLLKHEILNLLTFCTEALDVFPFSEETQDDRLLEFLVTDIISENISIKAILN